MMNSGPSPRGVPSGQYVHGTLVSTLSLSDRETRSPTRVWSMSNTTNRFWGVSGFCWTRGLPASMGLIAPLMSYWLFTRSNPTRPPPNPPALFVSVSVCTGLPVLMSSSSSEFAPMPYGSSSVGCGALVPKFVCLPYPKLLRRFAEVSIAPPKSAIENTFFCIPPPDGWRYPCCCDCGGHCAVASDDGEVGPCKLLFKLACLWRLKPPEGGCANCIMSRVGRGGRKVQSRGLRKG
mmetsp:Transcript_45963/g.107848  ORF Transcript_45963/g.107848 Transcript_45963/m.107848 type:complete len:235 (-) Transcript_45963:63-767(-)